MQEKSMLLNFSLASKDNITLAEDFFHGKDELSSFLSFVSESQASRFLLAVVSA